MAKTKAQSNLLMLGLCGIVTGVLFILFDMVAGILTAPIYAPYTNLSIWKVPPNIGMGVVFDLINGFILVVVYDLIFNEIPGKGWRKGLNYGIIVGLFRNVMPAFSTIVMYMVPLDVVLMGLVVGYLEIVILCTVLSVLYERVVTRHG